MKKKIISIEGTIINTDYSEIKESIYEEFEHGFFELLDNYVFGFYGAFGLVTEKELEKIEKQNAEWYVKEFFENKGFSDI